MTKMFRISLRRSRVEYENNGAICYRFVQLIFPGENKETSKLFEIFMALRFSSEKWNSGRKLVRFL